MSSRGVVYIKWGSEWDGALRRSIESLKEHHPQLPVHVHEAPAASDRRVKAQMARISPFEQTLYLDADTVLIGPVDHGFAKAEQFGLSCCMNVCPWARKHPLMRDAGDALAYDSGVMYFTRETAVVFSRWQELVDQDQTLDGANDQPALAAAIAELKLNPFVLPFNFNWRPRFHSLFFGPIRVYHDRGPVLPSLIEFSRQQSQHGVVIQHALTEPG